MMQIALLKLKHIAVESNSFAIVVVAGSLSKSWVLDNIDELTKEVNLMLSLVGIAVALVTLFVKVDAWRKGRKSKNDEGNNE